jgi:hypothetical protein
MTASQPVPRGRVKGSGGVARYGIPARGRNYRESRERILAINSRLMPLTRRRSYSEANGRFFTIPRANCDVSPSAAASSLSVAEFTETSRDVCSYSATCPAVRVICGASRAERRWIAPWTSMSTRHPQHLETPGARSSLPVTGLRTANFRKPTLPCQRKMFYARARVGDDEEVTTPGRKSRCTA